MKKNIFQIRKNKKFFIILLAFLAIFLVSIVTPVMAANDGFSLPDPGLFKPDLNKSSDSGKGFIAALNILIGFVSVVFLGYAVLMLVWDLKDLISGKKDLKTQQGRFIAIGVAALILLLALTGVWYVVLIAIWDKILVPVINALSGK
ncbi:hypothetical protein [Desulforamulus aquiferis]|uniref:Uncharacterized protein n=1 Tax=Desulforamulus aquiferis TaxID=1397668 RepID=A0AAW7Z9K7_9FIRM|nr:hypothetical protein [Desulforamulus aquiferis]MDO7785789.1 hypothetical protein [Desulforamulus aquiferis]